MQNQQYPQNNPNQTPQGAPVSCATPQYTGSPVQQGQQSQVPQQPIQPNASMQEQQYIQYPQQPIQQKQIYPQSPYATYQYQQQTNQPQKKKHTGLIIGITIGSISFLILLICLITATVSSSINSKNITYGNVVFNSNVTEELDSYGENVAAASWLSTISKINESSKDGSGYEATDMKTFMATDENGKPLYINCAKLNMPFTHDKSYTLATINGHKIHEFFDMSTYQMWMCLEYNGSYILIDPVQKAIDHSNIKDYQSFIESFIYTIDD